MKSLLILIPALLIATHARAVCLHKYSCPTSINLPEKTDVSDGIHWARKQQDLTMELSSVEITRPARDRQGISQLVCTYTNGLVITGWPFHGEQCWLSCGENKCEGATADLCCNTPQ